MHMQTYCTSDWTLAVTLSYMGYTLAHVDRSDPKRVAFCFERDESVDRTLELFWREQIQVEPRAFLVHQKMLKARLYSDS